MGEAKATEYPTYGNFINGKAVPALSGETFNVFSPEDGRVVGACARSGKAEAENAVSAATEAFKVWTAMTPGERELLFFRAADLLDTEEQGKIFMDWLIDEGGSTFSKARFEYKYAVQLMRTAGGEARRLYGDTFPAEQNQRMSIVIREPVGVVAAIAPFNAPLVLLIKMVAFPLAGGNTVVAKPSEETPMIAIEFARLLHRAGFPDGVFNVVTGLGAEAGTALVEHPGVPGVTFTGSTTVGCMIAAVAAKRMARVHMELGGKNPVLVLKDANIEEAAGIIAMGAFTHAGQICMSSSRIIAEKEVARPLAEAIARKANAMKPGSLRDPAVGIGPLINARSLSKVQEHVADAIEAGAELLAGGAVHEGLVYKPTVLFEPPRGSKVWKQETFGPVTSVVAVDGLDEAIAEANDSDLGLSCGILTNDMRRSVKAARAIRCGSVHIGAHSFQSDSLAPIGGYGFSSLGRSGGKYSVEHFTELKWISFNTNQAL